MKELFLGWTVAPTPHYVLDGVELEGVTQVETSATIASTFRRSALEPKGGADIGSRLSVAQDDAQHLKVLKALHHESIVMRTNESASYSSWILDVEGEALVLPCFHLVYPKYVFAICEGIEATYKII